MQQTVKSLIAAWVGIKVGSPAPQRSHVFNRYFLRPLYEISHIPKSPTYTLHVANTRIYQSDTVKPFRKPKLSTDL